MKYSSRASAKFKMLYTLREKYNTHDIFEPINHTPDYTYYTKHNNDKFKVLTSKQLKDGTWRFIINENKVPTHFVLIALDAEDNVVIQWLLPASLVNENVKVSLTQDSFPDLRL